MNDFIASQSRTQRSFIHRLFLVTALVIFALPGTASASEPDAKNSLPIRKNPTATVTGVCYRLDEKEYSQLIHATCYSEFKQAVVVLVSGKPNGMTGQAVAQHIVKEFQMAYIPAVAFKRNPEWNGVAIAYLLNGDYYGPYSGEKWREGFEILKVHSAQAWHK